MKNNNTTYCGFFALIGRPNVGKSTLLNQLVGTKVSITSSKPQTTRHRIIGINTEGPYQSIYIDTPGLNIKEPKAINRFMNRFASNAINNVDLIIFITAGLQWTPNDEMIVNKLRKSTVPVLLVINKIDLLPFKGILLQHLQFLHQQMEFIKIILISAKTGKNINLLNKIVRNSLPKALHHFPSSFITDRTHRFMASEIIREKLIRFLGAELPYSVTVTIEQFIIKENGEYYINGLIIIERESQKKIVIGRNGIKIKIISIEARKDMEKFFKIKVHLNLWVTVQYNWTNNEYYLQKLGYVNNF